jgi:hypothetical protein
MHRRFAYVLGTWLSGACLLAGFSGCSKTDGQSQADTSTTANDADAAASESQTASVGSPADREAAAQVVRDFLQAIKSGDETVSNDLLTPLARQKTAELDMAVAPMGSESASFQVGDVELPQEGEGELAHVASTWTDIDDDGREHTDEILWVLRREDEGWRIGGMATKVFEDQPPLLLDFEDPVDMRRKQQLAEAELERRAHEATEQADADAVKEDDAGAESTLPVADKRHSNARSQGTRNK